MAAWTTTKENITNGIEVYVRRLTDQEKLSFLEKKVVSDSINEAMQAICIDYGISRWRFRTSNQTVDTTAGQNYVDLTADVFNIVSGTVRIVAENSTLAPWDIEAIYSADPDGDQTGRPQMYALDSSGTANIIRLLLWPEPDAVFTISYTAELMVDEDNVSSFPPWMHTALKAKSFQLALEDLGMAEEGFAFERRYDTALAQNKASQGNDGPQAVRRVQVIYHSNFQSRAGL